MGHIDVSGVTYMLSDGRILLSDVSFRVGDGVKAALVGPNGAGKTTLFRLIAGDIEPELGAVARSGGLGVMRQFIVSIRDESTVRDLLISISPPAIREGALRMDATGNGPAAMIAPDGVATRNPSRRYRSRCFLATFPPSPRHPAEPRWTST